MDIETLKKERDDLLLALQQVKQWDINGWKERGFVLPTELRATIQALVAGASGRKCWNCAEVSEPCYDGGTPWCTKCGVVDNPSKPERPAAANAAGLDTVRLDFVISEGCQIEHMTRPDATYYRARWPYLEEHQREWSMSGREAIDAAMQHTPAAKGAAGREGGAA